MTTNTCTTQCISSANSRSIFPEAISRNHSARKPAAVVERILFYARWLGHTLHELLQRDEIVPIADVYQVREGNQDASRTMGRAYIEAEATLMNMRNQRIM